MRALWSVAAVASLAAATGCVTASPEWDKAMSKSLEDEVASMMKKMDAADFDGMLASMSEDATVFDFDIENKPTAMHNRAEIQAFFDGIKQAVEQGGAKLETTVVNRVARATCNMGYCMVEFDQVMTVNGQSMGPFHFRGTLVARHIDGKWRWDHWHGSFREMPAMNSGE